MTIHTRAPIATHDDVLTRIAEELDMPPSKYEEAVSRYEAIGRWLDRDNSTIKTMNPRITPQGSFLLGTVIKPLNDGEEYDVDLVCCVEAQRAELSQKDLKSKIGLEIEGYAEAHSMAEPTDGRRCWRLDYAASAMFHMDILPALPDADRYRGLLLERGYVDLARTEHLTAGAISITDKEHPSYKEITPDWHQSNPRGYGEWFRRRMLPQLQEQKRQLAHHGLVTASVDDIPDYKVKTPLQRVIQLLKRHRDNMFKDDPEHKPISIIITTLAAKSYGNSPSISSALEMILTTMHSHIEDRNGVRWVANPVNPAENFADKWAENPIKERNFRTWLEAARRDFGLYLHGRSYDRLPVALTETFGTRVLGSALGSDVMTALAAPTVARTIEDHEARTRAAAAERIETGTASKPWRLV